MTPIRYCVFRQFRFLGGISDAMEIIVVEVQSGDEKASRFLENPPGGFWVDRPVLFTLKYVEAQASAQAHSTDHRMIGRPIL